MGLVRDLCTEPREDRVVGNLFNFVMMLPPIVFTRQAPAKRETNSASFTFSKNRNVQEMFATPNKKKTPNVIVVDVIKVETNH